MQLPYLVDWSPTTAPEIYSGQGLTGPVYLYLLESPATAPEIWRLSGLVYLYLLESPATAPEICLIQSWSTLLVGYPKWKVDEDSGKISLSEDAKVVYRTSRTQTDTLSGRETKAPFLRQTLLP